MITPILEKIANHHPLSRQEAAQTLERIIEGKVAPEAASAFLMGLRTRGETPEELAGLVDVMQHHMETVELADPDAIDVCGTGGDGKATYNVSTTAAFILAAGGVTVAKHGNRAISSRSGSADVLQELGINIEMPPTTAQRCANELGITFFYAPFYHPAMKHLAPIRRNLGIRTVFNMLGPLLNPARVSRQVIGAFNLKAAELLAHTLARRGVTKALVVHSTDGYDEVSPFSPTHVFQVSSNGEVQQFLFEPPTNGHRLNSADAQGNSPQENAQIIKAVLTGERKDAARHFAVLNAAFGFFVADKVASIEEGIEKASAILESGAAWTKVQALAYLSDFV